MKATTAQNLYGIVKKAAGVKNDPEKAHELLNEARDVLYNISGAKETFFADTGCVTVDEYCDDCRQDCCGSYLAVTLPHEVTTVRELRIDGRRGKARSRMSGDTSPDGCCISACGCFKYQDMGSFSLPCPFPKSDKLRLYYHAPEDRDEVSQIRYTDPGGAHHIEEIGHDGGTNYAVADIDKNGLSFPVRCGEISVITESGDVIETYHPSVTAPQHRRYAILEGAHVGSKIRYDAILCPRPICFPEDTVEIADTFLLKYLLKIAELQVKDTMSSGEANALNAAMSAVAGIIEEHAYTDQTYSNPALGKMLSTDRLRAATNVVSRKGRYRFYG